jgi:hypothetical protein
MIAALAAITNFSSKAILRRCGQNRHWAGWLNSIMMVSA